MSLRKTFEQDFSRSAFKMINGEQHIVGKFGEIAQNDDGSFDVWIVNPNRSPIGTRKLNNIVSAICNTSWKADIHVLTGEAWFTTKEPALVREIAPLLGIFKRRTYSEEVLKRMREQAAMNLKGAA